MNTLNILGLSLTSAMLGTLLTLLILEWSVGCGEPIYKADGTWEVGECIIIPQEKPLKRGTWK
jgi:hypothetical protein